MALKDAAVAAGYLCPSWKQGNQVTAAAESGVCSDADVFMTFISASGRDQVVAFLKGNKGATILVGPNWAINSKGAPALQARLGGTVVRS